MSCNRCRGMSDEQLDGAPFITNWEKKHGTWPIPPSLKAKMKERDELAKSLPYPFGGFTYPHDAGECLAPSFSGTVTESEVKEAHITLKTADYQAALEHALHVTRLFSVLDKARQPSLWQRICGWFRNLFKS